MRHARLEPRVHLRHIELFAGDNADNNSRFFFDGAMDILKPYIDKKQLVVRSGQTNFTQLTIDRWDTGKAPDNQHPSELLVRLTLDVYKFLPTKAHGEECAKPAAP